MAKRYDAVVIGGGHNGLTTAAYLAKAGMSGWKISKLFESVLPLAPVRRS